MEDADYGGAITKHYRRFTVIDIEIAKIEHETEAKIAELKSQKQQEIERWTNPAKTDPTPTGKKRRGSPRLTTPAPTPTKAPKLHESTILTSEVTPAQLVQAQAVKSNILRLPNDHVVAIACHLCEANTPQNSKTVANSLMDTTGLYHHYLKRHPSKINVQGEATIDKILGVCKKTRVTKEDIRSIVEGLEPEGECFVAVSGVESKKRKGAVDDETGSAKAESDGNRPAEQSHEKDGTASPASSVTIDQEDGPGNAHQAGSAGSSVRLLFAEDDAAKEQEPVRSLELLSGIKIGTLCRWA